MLEKLWLWKFWKIFRKTSLVAFLLKKFELSNLPTYNYSEKWLHRTCFLCMLLEFLKLLWERLRCNHFLVKQQKLLFCDSVTNLTGAWSVPKRNSSSNFEKSPFNRLRVYSLQRCQKHLTKFQGVLKLTENFQEVASDMVPY